VLQGPVTHGGTISKIVPFVVAKVASAAGADPGTILDGSGISPEVVPSADDHIPIEGYFEVWRRTMSQVPDVSFPVRVASAFQLEDNEVFGFLAMSCATIRQAIERTVSYSALYCVGATWEIRESADEARIVWLPWPGEADDIGYRAAMDYSLADMANGIRRLGVAEPRPRAVRAVHRAPAVTAGFVDYYGVEPTFGSSSYEVVYAPGTPDVPLITFNSRLRDYFDEECRRLVSKMEGDPSVVVKVRKQLIGAMDGGDTSVEDVARRLGMSSRSLQRHLADEGTRYNDLLAEVRAEFAKRYLSRGSISASEVAYLLGFTEPPAFFKAFKRWTGMTPKEFQEGAAPR
jgi:AraC-like DNA-binding protein